MTMKTRQTEKAVPTGRACIGYKQRWEQKKKKFDQKADSDLVKGGSTYLEADPLLTPLQFIMLIKLEK